MHLTFRNDNPPSEIAPRFWDRKFVIYFVICFSIASIIEIGNVIAPTIDENFQVHFDFSVVIGQLILQLVSICIMIATAIIVVKKLCNKTLREHDDGRASRGSPLNKYLIQCFTNYVPRGNCKCVKILSPRKGVMSKFFNFELAKA
jgi:hypothetical protein